MKSATESPAAPGDQGSTSFEHDTKALTRKQAFEIVWPYAFGMICAIATGIIAHKLAIPDRIKDVFGAVASAAATVAGFMLAAAAILASIGDRPFIRQAKRAGAYTALIHYLFVSMRWCIGSTSISILAMLFDAIWKLWWYPVGLGVWGFITFTALFASVRALQTFTKVMVYVSSD